MPHLDSKSSELEPRAEKTRAQLAVAVVLPPEAGDMEACAIAAALASFRACSCGLPLMQKWLGGRF